MVVVRDGRVSVERGGRPVQAVRRRDGHRQPETNVTKHGEASTYLLILNLCEGFLNLLPTYGTIAERRWLCEYWLLCLSRYFLQMF
jgi:hypothetical protein